MAKKKKSIPQPLSPDKYIREKVRNLPIGKCTIGSNWKEAGGTTVVVTRCHKQGTFTIGTYFVDTFCRGIVLSAYFFNLSEDDYKDYLNQLNENGGRKEIDYVEAHNIIYGAIAFAEEAGLKPDKSFELTKYILEEDTEDIPLLEYEFGKNGKHLLIARNRLEANTYLPILRQNLEEDEYDYFIDDSAEEEMDDEMDDIDDPLDGYLHNEDGSINKTEVVARLAQMYQQTQATKLTTYSYAHPDYPTTLKLENQSLYPLFYNQKNVNGLSKKDITKVLSYPHESLVRDLEQIALYEMGCTCDGIPKERRKGGILTPMLHVLLFLGEVHGENSLNIVLETLRQSREYMDFHLGDSANDAYIPTLYLLGQNRLDMFLDFIKEPGLDTFSRYLIFPTVALIAREQPERRAEIIEWFRQVLVFYAEKIAENIYCDGVLAGMLMCDLLNMQAVELLPEIKALYDTNLVDKSCCGDYHEVEKELLTEEPVFYEEYFYDIYERYQEYKKNWG